MPCLWYRCGGVLRLWAPREKSVVFKMGIPGIDLTRYLSADWRCYSTKHHRIFLVLGSRVRVLWCGLGCSPHQELAGSCHGKSRPSREMKMEWHGSRCRRASKDNHMYARVDSLRKATVLRLRLSEWTFCHLTEHHFKEDHFEYL